jgi:hypothetical protein
LWKSSSECAFHQSNRHVPTAQVADTIRKHWGIENKQHDTRDVTFNEDASRIRRAPGIFARLRSFAHTSFASINPTRSPRIDTPPLSEESKP